MRKPPSAIRTSAAILLMVLDSNEHGVSTSELAEALGQRPNNITAACQVLERDRLIERHTLFGDQRCNRWLLTAAGMQEAYAHVADLRQFTRDLQQPHQLPGNIS